MRLLQPVNPTPDQLPILAHHKPGFTLIRGAAGSGKTTAALLRLRQLCKARISRRERLELIEPVRVLVLTYNRTLEGYVAELARQQVPDSPGLFLRVNTFGKWATDLVGYSPVAENARLARKIKQLGQGIPLDPDFLVNEVDYALGRLHPSDIDRYLTVKRQGRGQSPRVDTELRKKILDEVITPYLEWKVSDGVRDWHDLALDAAQVINPHFQSDVVIVDEAQDFTANQMRAIVRHLAEDHSTTFVIDATQRIYPRFFAWTEVGVRIPSGATFPLKRNYRNTKEIAALARKLVEGLPLEDDGMLPDFEACQREGDTPTMLVGTFSQQVDHALQTIKASVSMPNESIAFLHPKGGQWFSFLRRRLREEGIQWCELTRAEMWPSGSESVALCTIHSAKGLEFDHVFMLGLNGQVVPQGSDEGDDAGSALRRLVAMGVGRARKTVTIGYKSDDRPALVQLLDPAAYNEVTL
ncbi:3'-5' exonuclease [Micromonospora chokoriensis]